MGMGVKEEKTGRDCPKDRKTRYYASPYNESLKVKDNFTVSATRRFIDGLYHDCEEYGKGRSASQRNGYRAVFGKYVLSLKTDFDVRTINGEYLANFYKRTSGRREYVTPVAKALTRRFLLMNETYRWHPELDAVTRIVFPYWDDLQNVRHLIIPFLDGSRDAAKCRLYRAKSFNNGNPTVTLFDFDTDNGFIQDLLMEYQETRRGVQPGVYQLDFFRNFSQSLDNELPSDIYGFNASTLLKQECFFFSIRRETELENRFFYRFILERQGDRKTITLADGISLGYLMSENFGIRYADGYKYVPINPNEPVPVIDKWAVSPNGLEQRVASDKPEHIRYIDFTRISERTIRDAAKAWFWNESKVGFANRHRSAVYIIEFFEYRDRLRTMRFDKFAHTGAGVELDIKRAVLCEEVISYVNEWDAVLTSRSYMARIVPLKLFLRYMNDNDIYKTEVAAFEYLNATGHGMKVQREILPVPKADFVKLVAKLEERAKNSALYTLYYIVFCLNALTPLRISSILDLSYDCMIEKSKGIYALEVRVKTSGGDKNAIQISSEVKRLIEVALSLTANARALAPNSQKSYLFLVSNQKSLYYSIPQRSYARYLRDCCKAAGIPAYSPQNLRKTYYTNLIENAIKNNVSLMSLKELTGHANINTAENYYVKENIRNYLEAAYGVEIGNMPVSGSVVAEFPEAKREDIVNDGCGYCRNPECNILGTANCLMCGGFVTTPEHIPQFEEAMNVLTEQIVDNNNPHDKEHLYAVKRLYAAYMERLYLSREGSEDAAFS